MALHPIFQGIADDFMPAPANEGLRPVAEGVGSVVAQLERVVARKANQTVIQAIADAHGWVAPAHNSERYRALDFALDQRGTPYRFRGRQGAYDAWSLARACASYATQRDCIDVEWSRPSWGISDAEARKALTQWGLVEVKAHHASPGDFVVFTMPDEPLPGGVVQAGGQHIAILSSAGGELSWSMLPDRVNKEAKIIHAHPARAVTETWMGGCWADKLDSVWSFERPGPVLIKRAA